MCGRYTLTCAPDELREEFGIAEVPAALGPRYNLAPRQDAAVIAPSRTGELRLRLLNWGLVPWWADDPRIGGRAINARAETVATRPAFRDAFRERRCLIPADGFYEWLRPEGSRSGQPYRFRRADGRPLAFAGLWERWRSADNEVLDSFTILTRPATGVVAPIHDRMPVILRGADRDVWLDPATPPERLQALLAAESAEPLVADAVSTLVNSPANDTPECVLPLEVLNAPGGGE